jgi:spoIIIJ-associated protein
MSKTDTKTFVEKTIKELFELLKVEATFEVNSITDEQGEVITVVITSDEAGLLIGAHGATLLAIQSFLGMAVKQSTGEWLRVSVDIAGWKEKHEDYLVSLAEQAADRARSSGEAQHLYNLNAAQRRVIHTALSKESDLITESEGEGENRYLVVRAK